MTKLVIGSPQTQPEKTSVIKHDQRAQQDHREKEGCQEPKAAAIGRESVKAGEDNRVKDQAKTKR